jgi:hypothetical protein
LTTPFQLTANHLLKRLLTLWLQQALNGDAAQSLTFATPPVTLSPPVDIRFVWIRFSRHLFRIDV